KSQRFRWRFGGMQILRQHWRDLMPWNRHPDNHLTIPQRLDYFLGSVQWLHDLVYLGFTAVLITSAVLLWTQSSIRLRPLPGDAVDRVHRARRARRGPALPLRVVRVAGRRVRVGTLHVVAEPAHAAGRPARGPPPDGVGPAAPGAPAGLRGGSAGGARRRGSLRHGGVGGRLPSWRARGEPLRAAAAVARRPGAVV